jgi:hypothetical protein
MCTSIDCLFTEFVLCFYTTWNLFESSVTVRCSSLGWCCSVRSAAIMWRHSIIQPPSRRFGLGDTVPRQPVVSAMILQKHLSIVGWTGRRRGRRFRLDRVNNVALPTIVPYRPVVRDSAADTFRLLLDDRCCEQLTNEMFCSFASSSILRQFGFQDFPLTLHWLTMAVGSHRQTLYQDNYDWYFFALTRIYITSCFLVRLYDYLLNLYFTSPFTLLFFKLFYL